MTDLSIHSGTIADICRRNGVSRLEVFGSLARGDATDRSDVDLLVHYLQPKSLLRHVAFERQLSAALGRPVDLLTEAAISPYLRERIRREARVVYES